MNNLQIFENEEFGQVRTMEENGKILFCGSDIAKALGYARPNDAISNHCSHTLKHRIGVQTGIKVDGTPSIQNIEMLFIPEGDLYRLVINSKLPSADKFEKWVFDDVLPSIRKHGMYVESNKLEEMIQNPDAFIRVLKEYKKEKEEKLKLQQQIEGQRSKVVFADAVSVAKTTILVGELAKLLKQNGVDIGQNRLFERLRSKGYLIARKGTDFNMPTQKSMELGLFEIKETTIVNSDGSTRISKTTKVTGKGQQYFINNFLGNRDDEAV
ncbi:phage antirepressor KilAC domain-containing protein [Lachnospiraceae bacterium ZAX-1]